MKSILIASFAFSALSAQAAIGDKIGTNQPIGDGAHLTSFSGEAKSVTLSNGNVFFYWADQGTLDGDLGGVYGKVVAQNGTVVKATFPLDSAATGNQSNPFAAPLAGGGVAVAWNNSQTTSSTSPTNVFVRVFDNSGNAVSSPVRANETVTTDDIIPQVNGSTGIVPLPNGTFMTVIRINERGAAPNEDDDMFQIFSAAGAKIGTNQPIGDGPHLTSFSGESKSVTLSNGNVFFYWQDQGTLDGDLGGVFGKVVAQNGTVVKATFPLDTVAAGNQAAPFAAPLADGGVAVAWNNSQTTSSISPTNMFVRVFDNSGNAVSSPVQANETVTTVDIIPQVNGTRGIVPLPNGTFMSVIRINERGAAPNEDDDLFQLFSAAGAKIGTNQPIGDGPHLTSFSGESNSVTLSNGNVFFYWQDQGTLDGDLGGVYGKVVAQNGTVVKATFNLDAVATGNQAAPFAAPLAGGGVAVAWNNSQTTSSISPTNMFVRVFDNVGNAVSSPVQANETVTTVDIIPQVNGSTGIVPLPNGTFMGVIRINERGAAPNEDDDMFQLFEGPPVPPTVTTATQSAVTATSAILGGNVTADGGATVTERGIVWGTSTGPTTANNKVQNGSGTGAFSGTVTGLPANTTIFVRAYAINSVNTSYGGEISFTTPAPVATISVSPASVSEDGATNLTFTVTLSPAVPVSTTVNITTSGTATSGTDYTGGVTTLTIPANTATRTITIDPTVDGTVEVDETVILTVAAGTGYTVGAPASATGTILNDDVPSVTIAVSPANVAEDGAPNLVYTVTLNQASFSNLSVAYTVGGTATNGTDYATISSPLVITAGNTTGTITVNPTADTTIEANETVTLTLSAGAGYTVGVPNSATGTILNDDLPNLTINDVTANEGNSGTTNFTFTVSLSAPAGPGGVTFDIATANSSATQPGDYTANSLTGQTIPAGSSTYTFTVLVTGDTINEPTETFFVNVTNVINAIVIDAQGVGTIVNDDPLPSLSVDDVSVAEGNTGTTTLTFTVTLSAVSGQTVTVNYATADGTATAPADYTATSGTLTFAPGQTTRTISVIVIGDTTFEANETFFVNLSGATNATISDNQGLGTINNDDQPGVSITATTATAAEGGATGLYTFTRDTGAGDLTVNFQLDASSTATAGTDFNLSSGGSLTFTPGTGAGTLVIPDGQLTGTVTLTALVEVPNPAEAAETARLNIVAGSGYAPGASPNATVTITENSFLVTTTNDSGTGSLRQAVANANSLAGTDTITFSDGTGGTVNFTDAVQDTITLTSGTLTLSSNAAILGTGARKLAVSGNNASRVLTVNAGADLTLSGLTITGGASTDGGGVNNSGSLKLISCSITGNAVIDNSCAGVQNYGTLVVQQCLISGNTGNSTSGGTTGGLRNDGGTVTLVNSTISGNSVFSTGINSTGGVLSGFGGSLTIVNSTISANTTAGTGTGINIISGTATVANSIIAGHTGAAGSADTVGSFISSGGNLIGNKGTATGFTNGSNSDKVGDDTSPLNPQLAVLADNGGPTDTHSLLPGSPALNAGLPANVPADTFDLDGDLDTAEPIPFDQRGSGFLRAIGTVDIGAFELQKAVSITALDAAKAEGNGGATTNFTFTVARTGDLSDSVTLDWTVTGSGVNQATAADFTATTGQVTLNATEGSKVVNVVVNADNIVEPAEGFTVTLSNPTNGYVVNGATADGTINNDDTATILLTGGTAKDEGNTGTTTYTFTATLSQPVQGGVSVAYTTNDGTATVADNDYTDNDGSLNFPGSVANEQRTFDVLVTGDNKVEANEEFTAALGSVTGGHGSVTVGGTSQTGTITNDDSASISITDVTQLESGGGMNFTVSLTAPSDLPVTLDFATANNTAVAPGDYTSTSGTITFPANSITAQSIPVTILNDGEFEADETFFVNLTNLNAGGRNVSLADGQGQGTIQNDDALTISITATDDSADENTAATGTWRVSRNGTLGAITANLEVDLTSTAKPADWTQTGASFVSTAAGGVGTVTIPDGQSFVDITLTPVADIAAEADETVQLNVTAGIGYTPSNSPTRTVTIVRNDFAVTNTDDSGEGSLRQAVDNGNVLGGNPTITFEGAVFTDATSDTITLGGTQIPISGAMTLEGPGADLLAVSGGGLSRIFSVDVNPGVVTLRGVSLVAGRAVGAGDDGAGAAISFRFGNRLVIEGCRIADNTSDSWAGAINKYDGVLEIRDSTFSGNVANSTGTGGGAIFNVLGDLVIVNSTFSGNSAPNATAGNGGGGAILNYPGGVLVLSHSTVTGNRVGAGASGGGIDVWGNETITHSIIAGNFVGTGTTPSDIGTFGSSIESATHNLIGDAGTSGGITDGTGGNLVGNGGTGTRDIATVLDTMLSNNGGLTPTHKLVVGSPAIDAGSTSFDANAFTPALSNDQRGAGFTRVRKGLASSPSARIDIGAYELIEAPVFTNDDLEIETGSTALDLATASGVTPSGGTFSGTGVSGGFFDPTGLALGAYTVTYTVGDANGTNSTNLTVTVIERPSLTVTSTSDAVSKIDGQTSLREALAYAATLTGAQTVAFSNTTTGGAVNFHDAAPDTITLGGTELEIVGNVTVDGPGADLLTVDGNAASRVFHLPVNDPAIDITLRGVKVANGSGTRGGGLRVRNGILRIEACVFEGNVAIDKGGALSSSAVTLTLTDSTFLNNEADEGGAIEVQGDGVCRRGHFEGNQSAEDGGAIDFGGGTFIIADSLFTGNDAGDEGGAIENNGNDLILLNCTISGNTAGTAGGGINNQGGLTVVNSTITGNRADADGVEQSPGTPDEGLGGGGIRTDDNRGLVVLHNTIVAGNRRGAPGSDVAADLSTALPADIGVDAASSNNLIGDPGFVGELVHGVNGNIIGKEDSGGPRIEWPLVEILNPVLGTNGGATLTHALAIGSPAIDAGLSALAVDESSVPLATDQRGAGFNRIVKGLGTSAAATVDIGAYELFAAPLFAEDDLRISVDGSPVNLASATGASPAGGVFSGPGVSGGFFDPKTQVPGIYTLTYTVTDAFGVTNSANFTVTVGALPPALTLTQPKRFKTTLVGSSSRTQRVTVSNVGGLPTASLRVVVSGPAKKDFVVTQPETRSLEPGASTFFQVTFRPRKDGTRKAVVTVESDSPSVSVKLQGRGQSKSGIRPPRAVKK